MIPSWFVIESGEKLSKWLCQTIEQMYTLLLIVPGETFFIKGNDVIHDMILFFWFMKNYLSEYVSDWKQFSADLE